MNPLHLQITGRASTHVSASDDSPLRMHPDTLAAFERMRIAAASVGIALTAVSAFRDFNRQVTIWNHKWRGERPLYDLTGRLLDPSALTPVELVHAILTWSALPGASRHHWGSDIDVIDSAALPDNYRIELLPQEFSPDGPFHPLHKWLQTHMAEYGFFFPYKTYQGGVSPEPWHISHAPVATSALSQLTPEILRAVLRDPTTELDGADIILEMLPEIFSRFVININLPHPPRMT